VLVTPLRDGGKTSQAHASFSGYAVVRNKNVHDFIHSRIELCDLRVVSRGSKNQIRNLARMGKHG
jgi:hypothetical protein